MLTNAFNPLSHRQQPFGLLRSSRRPETMLTNAFNPLSHQQQPFSLPRGIRRPRRGRVFYFPPGRSRILAPRDEELILSPTDNRADQETTREEGPYAHNIVVCRVKNLTTRNPELKRKREDDQCDICVICQDDLNQENTKIAVLDCKHEYHEKCIERWLVNKNACPICRKLVVL